MQTRATWSAAGIAVLVLVFSAGCGDGAVPFDDLPLRDALRAQPDAVAALSDDSRARLAARLEAERTRDTSRDQVTAKESAVPATLLAALDAAREKGGREPLMAGVVSDGILHPLSEPGVSPAAAAADAAAVRLPVLEIPTGAVITAPETGALRGHAGMLLGALIKASGASRLRRVVGWPAGAVAIGDTVYVNGAWLVALSPRNDVGGAAGDRRQSMTTTPASLPSPIASGASAPAISSPTPSTLDGAPGTSLIAADDVRRRSSAVTARNLPDGGVEITYPPPYPDPPAPVDTADSCASLADACASFSYACSNSSDGSGDACGSSSDGSGDACGSSSDGSGDACASSSDGSDACSAPPDDGGASSCRVAPGPARRGPGTIVGLFMPLAFLLLRRRQ